MSGADGTFSRSAGSSTRGSVNPAATDTIVVVAMAASGPGTWRITFGNRGQSSRIARVSRPITVAASW